MSYNSQSLRDKVAERKEVGGLGLSGVPVDNVTMDEALGRIEDMIEEGGFHQVATANVDFLVHAKNDLEYRKALCMCDLVVADGMPIVWVSGLFGAPLSGRVAGSDMVPLLINLSAKKGYTIFLLGATPEVIEAAERKMQIDSPGVRIVGRMSPPIRPLDKFDNEPILAEIERVRPDILLVAFGSPKQEKWIARNRHRLNVPVCIGIGGTLDFMAGTVSRAPMWMQNSGLEWVFRMCVDPHRLIPRYFADAVWMARYLFVQVAVQQSFRLRQQDLEVTHDAIGTVSIFGVTGSLTGAGLDKLNEALTPVLHSGRPLVLDLTATSHVGADGLWALAGLLRRAAQNGCELFLAGLSKSLERQLSAAHFVGLFNISPTSSDAVHQIALLLAASEESVAGAA